MSDPVTALGGAVLNGPTRVTELGPRGMILLRGRPEVLAPAAQVVGLAAPAQRQIVAEGDRALAWMSPDEWLLLCPRDQAGGLLRDMGAALAGRHHLLADVSDMRSLFAIEGPAARDAIARLAPVDMDRLPAHELRRTRLAQIAAALWRDDGGVVTLMCYRSVARYAFDLLSQAAAAGPTGHFR